MSIDLQALVVINFVVQLLLMVTVFSAVFFVKVKHQLIRHGMMMEGGRTRADSVNSGCHAALYAWLYRE